MHSSVPIYSWWGEQKPERERKEVKGHMLGMWKPFA